jgi:hypothetical protein
MAKAKKNKKGKKEKEKQMLMAKKSAKKTSKKKAKKAAKKYAPKKAAKKKAAKTRPGSRTGAGSGVELGHAELTQSVNAVPRRPSLVYRRRRSQRLDPFRLLRIRRSKAAALGHRGLFVWMRGRARWPKTDSRQRPLRPTACVGYRPFAGVAVEENGQNCCWNATHSDNLSWNRQNA